jgi:glycosyltransferase involved in cell wall biosynthesis
VPLVSIGLSIYNAENYLAAQIESLLAQTLSDFDLIITDNASTDRTEEICRSYVARDRRVRYHRNLRNIGGGANQNVALELALPAPYFKWAAHDDVHAPRFLELCVAALEREPAASLAFCKSELIDAQGKVTGARVLDLPLGSDDVVARFVSLLPSYDCMEIYGVVRRDLAQPIGTYKDGDGVWLARLALIGRFVEVPEVLFYNRRHSAQAGTQFESDYRGWTVWWDARNAKKRTFPTWRREAELWRVLLASDLPPRERLRCALALARWEKSRRHRFVDDIAFHAKDIMASLVRSAKS